MHRRDAPLSRVPDLTSDYLYSDIRNSSEEVSHVFSFAPMDYHTEFLRYLFNVSDSSWSLAISACFVILQYFCCNYDILSCSQVNKVCDRLF